MSPSLDCWSVTEGMRFDGQSIKSARSDREVGVDYVVFGVNIGNLGRNGPEGRPTSAELCQRWNTIYEEGGTPFYIWPAYRGTGNFFLAGAEGWTVEKVAARLRVATRRGFAVFTKADYLAWVCEFETALPRKPEPLAGRRMTPGAVMDTNPNGGMPPVPPSVTPFISNGFVRPRVLGVYKVDRLRRDGRALDASVSARDGGWGAIAQAMRRKHGGEWTARALSTLAGVAGRLTACSNNPLGSRARRRG